MKKSYLMIAVAASLLASCSDTDAFKETANERNNQKAFNFYAYTDKVTKGTNSTSLQDFYKVFGVYGFKNVTRSGGATDETVFSNVPNEFFASDTQGDVVYKTSPAKPSDEWSFVANSWYYEDVRYWDKMANSYAFFAIAPYEATPAPALTVAATDANIQIGSSSAKYDISTEYNLARTVFSPSVSETEAPKAALTYSGFKKDYMLAEKSTARTSDVMLNFHHILAKLNVKIVKDASYKGKQELKINELKIDGLAKEGYYAYNTNFTTKGWTTSDTYARDIAADYSLTATTNYSGNYWIETLMFPQTATCQKGGAQPTATALTDMYLYIKYSIGTEVFEAYYDLAYVFDKTLVYTAAEAITHNAALTGALNAVDPLGSNTDAYNTAMTPATPKTSTDVLSEDEAAAYNAKLTDAVAANDIKVSGSGFTFNQGSEYNLTLTVGPDPIHFDAVVTAWNEMTEVVHTVD